MKKLKRVDLRLLAGVILFGSLWGALEATLGATLIILHFPHFGAIMANIGFMIMAMAVALYKRPGMQIGIGFVAASFKLLDAALFGVSPFAQMIFNPMVAIILEALAFEIGVAILWQWYPRRMLARAGAGVLAMYLYYIGMSLVFLYVLHRGRHQLMELGVLPYVLRHGGVAALIALFSNPLGYRIGRLIKKGTSRLAKAHPWLLYSSAIAITLLCWFAGIWSTLTL